MVVMTLYIFPPMLIMMFFFFFVNRKDDVNMLGKNVNDFKCISSAKVNWGKSEALLEGNWSGDLHTLPGEFL